MGRIKTQRVKRVTHKILNENPQMFKEDFSENKKLVSNLLDVKSKKLRNIIAGYLTRLIKSNKEI